MDITIAIHFDAKGNRWLLTVTKNGLVALTGDFVEYADLTKQVNWYLTGKE